MVLVKFAVERALCARDEKALDRLLEKTGSPKSRPTRLKELIVLDTLLDGVTQHEATLVQGYINNTLPGAFRATELNNWYIFEKQGDLTPLKLARFAINLLERNERTDLLGPMAKKSLPFTHPSYDRYR